MRRQRLDAPRDAEDRQLITLGHELRHVLEVAREPGITSHEAFDAYFRAIGQGQQVAAELGASPE